MRHTRLCLFHILLLGLILMLTACTQGSSPPTARIPLTSPSSSLRIPSPTPAPLGPPPLDCPVRPPPKTLDFIHFGNGNDTHFLGSPPVWMAASVLPNPIHVGTSPTWKIVVEVGPNYLHPVSLRMSDLRTGAIVQWAGKGYPPTGVTQTVILDPQQQDPSPPAAYHGPPEVGWNEWGVYPMFASAGCYRFEVSWPEGQWQSILVVGS